MARLRSIASLSAIALTLAVTPACGGDDDGAPPDAGSAADASGPDATTNTCVDLEAMYPDLGSKTGTALVRPIDEDFPNDGNYLSLQIPLNQESPPDVLFVELWSDTPPFDENGFEPKSVSLIADQADLIQCGACVYISPDHMDGQNIDFHMAAGGNLMLDAIDDTAGTGQVKGTLTDLVLRQVTVSQMGQTTVQGGCRTSIDAVAFDFTVATP